MSQVTVPSVSQSWGSIDAWLGVHTPRSLATLNPPAADLEVQAAQRAIGVEFPIDLVESLSCHDGLRTWANILPEAPPLNARRIAEHWQACMDIAEVVDGFEIHPGNEEPWWHPLWVPWAEEDGDAQVIDLRPGPHCGRLGIAVHDGCGDFSDSWPSLAAYLHDVAQVLHDGGAVRGWYPYLTEDHELWWDRGDDRRSLNGDPLWRAPVGRVRS
jgi:cell wall assembly regulator SMI1